MSEWSKTGKAAYEAADRFGKWLDRLCGRDELPSKEELESAWLKVFNGMARHLGFRKRERRMLYGGLDRNWDRLHPTPAESSVPSREWLRRLRGEVGYCSDCWSLTRLMRCNWLVQQVLKTMWEESDV